jgi:hypothetical protein
LEKPGQSDAGAVFDGGSMNRFAVYFFSLLAGLILAACAGLDGNEIRVAENQKAFPDSRTVNNLATIHIGAYVDGRNISNSRKIGVAEARVIGLSGKDLVLDRDVSDVVIGSMRNHLEEAGFRIVEKEDPVALFELSGVIKELKYDVKSRDYVSIKLETTLKEKASAKVVWHGEVEQVSDRFAGVSGNSMNDIAKYLKQELGVVTGKTTEAISTVLMATRPELFNLVPGTKVIPGVTVFVTPDGAQQNRDLPDRTSTSMLIPLNSAPGLLVIRTEPARAKVYLDGVYYGMSPLNIESAAGIRSVEVKLKGYKNASEKVAVRTGATTEMEFQLEK